MARKGSSSTIMGLIGHQRGDSGLVSPFTTYHELMVAAFHPIITLDASNGLSTIKRDTIENLSGSGSVTESDGELLVSSGTTAGSTARLRTKERGRYQVGVEALASDAIRIPEAPEPGAGGEVYREYGDDVDAMRLGLDDTYSTNGAYARIKRNSVWSDKVYQPQWSDDSLDGNGPSGLSIVFDRYNVFRNPFGYYGAGPNILAVEVIDENGRAHYVMAHHFPPPVDAITLTNPKLPLREGVDNGSSTQDLKCYVGGRQFSIQGEYDPNRRNTPERFPSRTVTGGTEAYVASFRKKSARKFTTRSVKVNLIGGTAGGKGRWNVYLGQTLTGASPAGLADVPADETALEKDTAATDNTGGALIRSVPVSGGQGGSSGDPGIVDLGVDLPEDTWVTLTFEDLSGSNNTVEPYIEFQEEA